MPPSFLNRYKVLILEESSTVQELLSGWLGDVSTITVTSPAQITNEFDGTVTVVCLSQNALGDRSDTVKKYILTRNPYCQIIGILPRSSFVTPYEDQFDVILQRPLFKEDFQDTVEYRFIAGAYSNILSELYDINATLLAIKRASEEEISDKLENMGKIKDRHEKLQSNLNTLQDRLSSDTIVHIMQTIENHDRYLKEPDSDTEEGQETKYHPRRCPSCKLPWGVDHRNDLGEGYKQLGADVHQCARCGTISHGLAGEQRVL